jgi:hypothetical protein
MGIEFGTLYIALPCIEGRVICTDKSVNNEDGMVRTDMVKIHRLGKKAAFTLTGLAYAPSLSNAPVFDPKETVKAFFADKNLNYIDKQRQALACTLQKAIHSALITRCGVPGIPPEKTGCQVLVSFLDAHNILRAFRIEVSFDELRTEKARASISDVDVSLPDLSGHCDPFVAICGGTFPEVEYLRRDPRFEVVAHRAPELRGLAAREVAGIARYIIRACSQASPVVTPQNISISEESDCCVLDRNQGFYWLNEEP